MALTTAVHESLVYIDKEPTPAERAAAQALIDAELAPNTSNNNNNSTPTHPLLPPLPPQHFSPYIETEHLRIQAQEPLAAIDLSRYEALTPPETTPHSDEDAPATLVKWRQALAQAYTSHAYLAARQTNLHLLEEFGKNAWLVGNSRLEEILGGLERELAERKAAIDALVVQRRSAQESVGGEMKGLEEGWKRGVGRVLETEVAAEAVRREILDRRRVGAT